MLHEIPVTGLRLGMYITALDCSWLESPFWRTRFLLQEQADLDLIRRSAITMVTIDDRRGLGPSAAAAPAPPAASEWATTEDPCVSADPVAPPSRSASRRRRETEEERARVIVDRSKAAVMRMFAEARLGNAVHVVDIAPMVEEIAASMQRDRSAILNITRLKSKNEYTYLHSVAVCALMINLARQLGLGEDEVQRAGIAGLLHDIGKMATPEAVLEKPGRLDEAERRVIQNHPRAGYDLLRADPDVSAVVLDVCLHHHERVDGRGYPEGLGGDQLSIYARMGAICDVYDAITSDRPYKRPWAPAEALARMLSWDGHFDERILRTFIAAIGIHPVGGVVRLRTNRLALVIRSATATPTTPVVRAFYDIAEARFLAPVEVGTGTAVGDDMLLGGESGDHWFGQDWPAVRAAVEAGTMPVVQPPLAGAVR